MKLNNKRDTGYIHIHTPTYTTINNNVDNNNNDN